MFAAFRCAGARRLPALVFRPPRTLPRFYSIKPVQSPILSQTRAFRPSARFFSANNAPAPKLPVLSPPPVAGWLMLSSTLVLGIMVVGAVTRLTESGLSITEWKPITGIIPPITQAQWEDEFEKYKRTPEFKLLKHTFTLDEFKSIFFWEWGHRVLGRVLGVAFLVPLGYFAARKKLTPGLLPRLSFYTLLIGAQGAMGWYMVKSGLEESIMTTPGAVPRVSQYRLAAHLSLAFVLYIGMFSSGMNALKDWKFAHGRGIEIPKAVYENPIVKRFKLQALAVTGLVLTTAISGAFVAGLDAGLLYNEWPKMGGQWAPPSDELFSPAYAKKEDKSDLWWRNILENPTTVQFDHRMLAITTYCATGALYAKTFLPAVSSALPPLTKMAAGVAFGMANVQVLLGISTLLMMVPIPLAAAHQAGAVMLLSGMVHVLIALRRPGSVARLWRRVNMQKQRDAATAAGFANTPTGTPGMTASGLSAAKDAMKASTKKGPSGV